METLGVSTRVGAVRKKAMANPAVAQRFIKKGLDERCCLNVRRIMLDRATEAVPFIDQTGYVLASGRLQIDSNRRFCVSLL